MTRVSNDVSFTWGQAADWCFFGFLFGFAVKWERFGRLFLCIFLVHEPTESELVPINASYFFIVENFVSSSILSCRRLLEKKWSVFSLTYFFCQRLACNFWCRNFWFQVSICINIWLLFCLSINLSLLTFYYV